MTSSTGPLILIVEDDINTSRLLTAYLARDGYRTVAAYDGQQALKLFASEQPQLLILDVMLPLLFMRDELLSQLYPRGESVVDRVVDVHVGKLRQKIEADPTQPEFIITARGTGYRFADRLV